MSATRHHAHADAPIVEQLDALFAEWDRSDRPGLVVGVVRDGRALYRRAFGMASLETRAANTLSTRMRIGSTSKHFAALLLLAEDGLVDLVHGGAGSETPGRALLRPWIGRYDTPI